LEIAPNINDTKREHQTNLQEQHQKQQHYTKMTTSFMNQTDHQLPRAFHPTDVDLKTGSGLDKTATGLSDDENAIFKRLGLKFLSEPISPIASDESPTVRQANDTVGDHNAARSGDVTVDTNTRKEEKDEMKVSETQQKRSKGSILGKKMHHVYVAISLSQLLCAT
jgi:hypothetical protein